MRISANQRSALAATLIARFEDEVLDDLRTSFPDVVHQRGIEATRALVHETCARAQAHGFTAKAHVAQYIGLAFVLGARFDTDRALPWAAEILRARGNNPALCLEKLRVRAVAHLQASSTEPPR